MRSVLPAGSHSAALWQPCPYAAFWREKVWHDMEGPKHSFMEASL